MHRFETNFHMKLLFLCLVNIRIGQRAASVSAMLPKNVGFLLAPFDQPFG